MSEFECTETKLTPIRVETLGPFVFANIDPEAISLADIAGDMLEDMRAKISWLDGTLVPLVIERSI